MGRGQHSERDLRQLLDEAEELVSSVPEGDTGTEDLRYVEAVASRVVAEGERGNWPLLAAAVVFLTSSGTAVKDQERVALMSRVMMSRAMKTPKVRGGGSSGASP